jgi:hypothetical protein
LSLFILPDAILLTFPFRALDEKEQLIKEHRKALDAQELYSKGLKDQLIQLGLKHSEAMKAAQAAAETKLNEAPRTTPPWCCGPSWKREPRRGKQPRIGPRA